MVKVKYIAKDKFVLYEWIKVKQVYVLKTAFLVVYEAEIDDKNGSSFTVLLHLEYPRVLLHKFKRRYGLS